MKTRIYTLENGLTVMFSSNKEKPRIYTCIATRAGSKNDPKNATGLAHYLEHMLFKGTDKFGTQDYKAEKVYLDQIDSLYVRYAATKDSVKRKKIYHRIDSVSGIAAKFAIANEYDKMMQHIGATGTNAFTSFDQTVYINDIPSNKMEDWINIEAERFRNPVLRLFHTELEAVYEEKNISLDSDDDKVFEELFAGLFPHHTYGTQTTIGTVEHLKNPSLKKIREFYQNWYVPNNMVIVMAGEFSYDKAIDLIDKTFGSFSPKEVPEFKFSDESKKKEPVRKTVKGPESEYVTIGFRLPAPKEKDDVIMAVSEMILQNGKSGLFDLNLIKKQKVLEADAGIYNLHDYSVLYMQGRPQEGQTLQQVEKLMLDQLDSLKAGKFSQSDLDAIILNATVEEMQQLENNSSRAFKMVDAFIQETPWNEIVERTNLMKKVTREDIMNFARVYLNNDFTVVYKVQGDEINLNKISKPEITPVEVNRNAISRFTKDILDNEYVALKPVFVNYQKDFNRKLVNNDVEILHLKNKSNSLFRLNYVFEFGSQADQQLPFAVNLLEYLGTSRFSAEEISRQFYSIGCTFNVYAGSEQTYVSLSGPQERFERAISTLEHLLREAVPDKEPLKILIEDEIKDRMDSKSNKYIIRNALSAYTRYGADNPFNYVLSQKKLKKLKASALVKKINNLHSYPHKILYYGPADTTAVYLIINKYHVLPEKMKTMPESKKFEFRKSLEPEVFFTNHDMVQAEIGWSANEENFNPALYPDITLFNEYFGGGMSSIVFQTIRESKALAYSSYAFFSSPSDKSKPYFAGAYIGTQADKLDSAIHSMNSLLTNMPQSELLFNASKSAIISKIESERITGNSILFSYLAANRLGLTEDSRKLVYEKVPSMTLANVDAFHKSHFANQKFNLYVLASDKKVPREKLSAYGRVHVIPLKELFGY
ncbi:MAG: insulinase family protein [Bacteroidia bacterium]